MVLASGSSQILKKKTSEMFGFLIVVLFCAGAFALDPDVNRNCSEMIRVRGYPAEEHEVVTSDGFILRMFRIPHGRHSTSVGPPVFILHALLCSSDEFVMDSPESSLAYVLADAGFDGLFVFSFFVLVTLFHQKKKNFQFGLEIKGGTLIQ